MEIDALAAARIGAAFIAMIWHFRADDPPRVTTKHEGRVWFVQYIGPEPIADGDMIVEPLCVAIRSDDGRLLGGAFDGISHARASLAHRVFRGKGENGLDMASLLDGRWKTMLARAKPTKPDASAMILRVEELLGPEWTVHTSGRASGQGRTVLLRSEDAAFLRALAAVRLPADREGLAPKRVDVP